MTNGQQQSNLIESRQAQNTVKSTTEEPRSVQEIQAPEPPKATKQPPQMTVDDPMRDGAVFNQPVDDQSLTATDFPVMDATTDGSTAPGKDIPVRSTSSTSLALSRTSNDSRSGSATDQTQATQKRQQRKLTKPRGNSDTSLARDKPHGHSDTMVEKLVVEKTAERPRGILTKKDRQTKSSPAVEDGERPENTPLVSRENTSANGSAPTQSSSLKDRFFG